MKPVTPQAPIDESVKVPAAIAAQAARAEALQAEVYPTEQPKPATPPADDGLIKLVPAAPPAPIVTVETSNNPPPLQPELAPVTTQGNDADLQHKLRSAEGRYAQQLRANGELREQIGNLTNLIETLSEQIKKPEPAAPSAPVQVKKLLTDEEIETYGSDFINVVERIAQQATTAELEAAKAHITSLESQLGKTTKTVTTQITTASLDRMEADLDRDVPTWRDINLQDNFYAWLQLPNVYTGVKRHAELQKAWEERKTSQVIAYFQGFLSEEAALIPTDNQPSPSTPATPPAKKTPLETLAAPGRARTPAGGSPPPAEKPFITASEISTFYRDVNRGLYKGKDDEKNRREQEIWAAQREGRIKP